MNEILKLLEDIKTLYPIVYVSIIVLIILGFGLRFLISTQLYKDIKEYIYNRKEDVNLDKSPLFSCKNRFNIIISNFKSNNKEFDNLFKKLLTLKTESIILKSKEISCYKNKCRKCNLCEGYNKIYENIYENIKSIISDYENNFQEFCILNYGTNGKEISEYILLEFNNYHQNNVNYLLQSIQLIEQSNIFIDTSDILNYYFISLLLSLQNGIMDAEKTFKTFNGHLTKLMKNKI